MNDKNQSEFISSEYFNDEIACLQYANMFCNIDRTLSYLGADAIIVISNCSRYEQVLFFFTEYSVNCLNVQKHDSELNIFI